MVYLDWAATARPDAAVLKQALDQSIAIFANPSSQHSAGVEASKLLESIRQNLLSALGCPSAHIAFTGGGTEACSLPLLGLLKSALAHDRIIGKPHMIISALEHSAIFEQALALKGMGVDLTIIEANAQGHIEPALVAQAVRKETRLVSIIAVNNEIGSIQPIAKIASDLATTKASAHFHVDAVQALGKIPLIPVTAGVTSTAFSAHKIGGPRGVGAIWYSNPWQSLSAGGGQEKALRPGTENIFGIAAFASVADKAIANLDGSIEHAKSLLAHLFEGLPALGAIPIPQMRTADNVGYSPWIVALAFPAVAAEVLVRCLSEQGIAISAGSACHSRSAIKKQRILDSIGVEKHLAESTIRVSFGPTTSLKDIDAFLNASESVVKKLRSRSIHA